MNFLLRGLASRSTRKRGRLHCFEVILQSERISRAAKPHTHILTHKRHTYYIWKHNPQIHRHLHRIKVVQFTIRIWRIYTVEPVPKVSALFIRVVLFTSFSPLPLLMVLCRPQPLGGSKKEMRTAKANERDTMCSVVLLSLVAFISIASMFWYRRPKRCVERGAQANL